MGVPEQISYLSIDPGETYYLRIGSWRYASNDDYTLSVNFETFLPTRWTSGVEGYIPFHHSGMSNDVQSLDANINYFGDTESYVFAGDGPWAGEYTITVGDFGNIVDPVVAVYDYDTGDLLAANDDISASFDDAQVSLLLDGFTNYIVVTADDNGDALGDLEVFIESPQSTNPLTITLDANGDGSRMHDLSPNEDTDFFQFTAPLTSTGYLTVTASPAATLDTVLYLFDEFGMEVDRGVGGSVGDPTVLVFNDVQPLKEYDLSVLSRNYATSGASTIEVNFGVDPLIGDFNFDHVYGCEDVNALVAAIVDGLHDPSFDLTNDMLVDNADLDLWLAAAAQFDGLGSPYKRGDANLDGFVDGQDFIRWNTNKFQPIAAWCAGDFTADGFVDGQDFIVWNENKFQSSDGSLFAPTISAQLGTPFDAHETTRMGIELVVTSQPLTSRTEAPIIPPYPIPTTEPVDMAFASYRTARAWSTHSVDGERGNRFVDEASAGEPRDLDVQADVVFADWA